MSIETGQSPLEVLAGLMAIEAGFGRSRSDDPALRYAPRTLDLDLLDFEGVTMETETLDLPHPRLEGRGFVTRPLADIAPGWRHPVSGRTASALASAAMGAGGVHRLPFVGP